MKKLIQSYLFCLGFLILGTFAFQSCEPPDKPQTFDLEDMARQIDSLDQTPQNGVPGLRAYGQTIVDPATFTVLSSPDSLNIGLISRRNNLWRYLKGEDAVSFFTMQVRREPYAITRVDTINNQGWIGYIVRNGWADTDTIFAIGGDGTMIPLNTVGAWTSGGGSVALNDLTDVTSTSPTFRDIIGYNGSGWAEQPSAFWYNSTSGANRSQDDVSFTGSHSIDSLDFLKFHDADGSGKRWKFEEISGGQFTLEYGSGTAAEIITYYVDGTWEIGGTTNPYKFPANATGATAGDALIIDGSNELDWGSAGAGSLDTVWITVPIEDRNVNLPGTAQTIGGGFYRVPPYFDGWVIQRVAYTLEGAPAGGTYDIQMDHDGANLYGRTFSAGDFTEEATGTRTINDGDLITVETPSTSSATTEPQGLVLHMMIKG